MRGKYKIAGHVIEIESQYADVHILCRGYQSSAASEFSIIITRQDIEYERILCASNSETVVFGDGYLESLAVYRRLAEWMLNWDTMLFHGSAVMIDNQGYMFTGMSGIGKSTHARIWRLCYGERVTMINDDKPLLKIESERVTVFGTPWSGKHRLDNNISSPLRAICVLQRGERNTIMPLAVREAYPILLQQCHRPSEPCNLTKTLTLLDCLMKTVRIYQLYCNMDLEAGFLAYQTMSKE